MLQKKIKSPQYLNVLCHSIKSDEKERKYGYIASEIIIQVINMKRSLIGLLCIVLILIMTACKGPDTSDTAVQENPVAQVPLSGEQTEEISAGETMKLLINDKEIPVIWEENDTIREIAADTANNDIEISMSKYSDFEQVGSLGKKYTRSDKQTTTQCGDIVLYNGNSLVVFYGANSWAYTRLGKINLSKQDVIELLSDEDVTITLKR